MVCYTRDNLPIITALVGPLSLNYNIGPVIWKWVGGGVDMKGRVLAMLDEAANYRALWNQCPAFIPLKDSDLRGDRGGDMWWQGSIFLSEEKIGYINEGQMFAEGQF